MDINTDFNLHFYNPEARSFNTRPSQTGTKRSANTDGAIHSSAISTEQHSSNATSAQGAVSINQERSNAPPQSLTIGMPSDPMHTDNDQADVMFESRSEFLKRQFERPQTARRGRGRAANHGAIIPIANDLREKSLAETRIKRARQGDTEPLDETEQMTMIEDDSGVTRAAGKHTKKRAGYSCDHCFIKKTRVPILITATEFR